MTRVRHQGHPPPHLIPPAAGAKRWLLTLCYLEFQDEQVGLVAVWVPPPFTPETPLRENPTQRLVFADTKVGIFGDRDWVISLIVNTEEGIPGPYLGLHCWGQFVNLRQGYDEETVEVEYRFYPDTEVIPEAWTVDKQGRSTFLFPPDSTTFLTGLLAQGAEELRMQVEYET